MISIVLLLFTSLCFAARSNPRLPRLDSTDQRTGCLNPYDSSHKIIVFHDLRELQVVFKYVIDTKYHTYYPKALENSLCRENFQLQRELWNNEYCGWQKARSVHKISSLEVGTKRGDIYWKHDDLRWQASLNDSNVPSHWVASSDNHIPPRTGQPPSNTTLDTIERILQENEPAGDVYEVSTICLGYACGLLGFLLLMVLARYCAMDSLEAEPPYPDTPAPIKLSTIKVHDRPELASTSKATLPTKCIMSTYPSWRETSMLSSDTTHSEPLPIYSVGECDR